MLEHQAALGWTGSRIPTGPEGTELEQTARLAKDGIEAQTLLTLKKVSFLDDSEVSFTRLHSTDRLCSHPPLNALRISDGLLFLEATSH